MPQREAGKARAGSGGPVAARVNIIVGETGCGKSRLLKALTERRPRLLVADTMGEHDDLAAIVSARVAYKAVRGSEPFRLGVIPRDRPELDWVCALAASHPHITLALEEYSFWYPLPQSQPSPGLMAVVRLGRKLEQSVYVISQSPVALNKHVVGQATLWVFPCDEVNDCKYVTKRTRGRLDPGTIPAKSRGVAPFRVWHKRELYTGRLDLASCRIGLKKISGKPLTS